MYGTVQAQKKKNHPLHSIQCRLHLEVGLIYHVHITYSVVCVARQVVYSRGGRIIQILLYLVSIILDINTIMLDMLGTYTNLQGIYTRVIYFQSK